MSFVESGKAGQNTDDNKENQSPAEKTRDRKIKKVPTTTKSEVSG